MDNFDYQSAVIGRKICTRDGRKARILREENNIWGDRLVVEIYFPILGTSEIFYYSKNGKINEFGKDHPSDLMMEDDFHSTDYHSPKTRWSDVVKVAEASNAASIAIVKLFQRISMDANRCANRLIEGINNTQK